MGPSEKAAGADDFDVERGTPMITSFGLSDRQTRFLNTVVRHSGVFVGGQYADDALRLLRRTAWGPPSPRNGH